MKSSVRTLSYVVTFVGASVGSIIGTALKDSAQGEAKGAIVGDRLVEAWQFLFSLPLWKATGDTLGVFLFTETGVIIVGFLLAWLLYSSKKATVLLEPIIQIMRPIPSIATIAIGAMLVSSSSASLAILVAFIGSLWPFTIAVLDTFRRVPVALRESTLTLGKSKRRFYGQVLILAALPGLFSAVRLVAPITLLLTVTTQYFYQHLGGLGALLFEKHNGLAYPKVISIIIILSLIGISIELGLRRIEYWVCKWRVEPAQ